MARTGTWSDNVTVILHRIPESEEHEGGYEAKTITAVYVKISGGDSDSREDALNHLLYGLRAFGFAERVAVEDTTYKAVCNAMRCRRANVVALAKLCRATAVHYIGEAPRARIP